MSVNNTVYITVENYPHNLVPEPCVNNSYAAIALSYPSQWLKLFGYLV